MAERIPIRVLDAMEKIKQLGSDELLSARSQNAGLPMFQTDDSQTTYCRCDVIKQFDRYVLWRLPIDLSWSEASYRSIKHSMRLKQEFYLAVMREIGSHSLIIELKPNDDVTLALRELSGADKSKLDIGGGKASDRWFLMAEDRRESLKQAPNRHLLVLKASQSDPCTIDITLPQSDDDELLFERKEWHDFCDTKKHAEQYRESAKIWLGNPMPSPIPVLDLVRSNRLS